jgi:hypothetical protein
MGSSVLYMSMSLDGYIAGPNDAPDNPGGDDFMRLHEWFGFASDAGRPRRPWMAQASAPCSSTKSERPVLSSPAATPWNRSITGGG